MLNEPYQQKDTKQDNLAFLCLYFFKFLSFLSLAVSLLILSYNHLAGISLFPFSIFLKRFNTWRNFLCKTLSWSFKSKLVGFFRSLFYWDLYQSKINLPCIKTLEHEYIFSKYSLGLNISEIFWACHAKNNFPIIFPKFQKPYFLTSIEI